MGIKSLVKSTLRSVRNRSLLRRYAVAPPGSPEWLIATEIRFGGMVTDVPRRKVSPRDPRSEAQLRTGGMIGGDRMADHGYASKYAAYLAPFVSPRRRIVLAEFGILRGTGLALWSELFPDSRILGFDIDLEHTRGNLPALKARGAFRSGDPELHELDQFVDNTELLGRVLGGDRIDVAIDDGYHSNETVMNTLRASMPVMADRFVFFIEDNRRVHEEIGRAWPDLHVDHDDQFTVVARGVAPAGRTG